MPDTVTTKGEGGYVGWLTDAMIASDGCWPGRMSTSPGSTFSAPVRAAEHRFSWVVCNLGGELKASVPTFPI